MAPGTRLKRVPAGTKERLRLRTGLLSPLRGSGSLWTFVPTVETVGYSRSSLRDYLGTATRRRKDAAEPVCYCFMAVHFWSLLELATTVSIKSMPRTPASTPGKSRASSLGFSPAMAHLTVSQKFM